MRSKYLNIWVLMFMLFVADCCLWLKVSGGFTEVFQWCFVLIESVRVIHKNFNIFLETFYKKYFSIFKSGTPLSDIQTIFYYFPIQTPYNRLKNIIPGILYSHTFAATLLHHPSLSHIRRLSQQVSLSCSRTHTWSSGETEHVDECK